MCLLPCILVDPLRHTSTNLKERLSVENQLHVAHIIWWINKLPWSDLDVVQRPVSGARASKRSAAGLHSLEPDVKSLSLVQSGPN